LSLRAIFSPSNLDYSRVKIAAAARKLGSGFVVNRCSRTKQSPFFHHEDKA
jgi:hypothetical protein